MRSRRAVLLAALLVLGACSSSGSSQATPTNNTTSPTGASPSTTGPLPDLDPAPLIDAFRGPPSPVPCSAPTSIELHWETPVTATVELRIDGGDVIATYPGGRGDHLVSLACDGRAQTYELTVHGADGTTASKKLTIQERRPS